MDLLDELKEYGVNVEEGTERVMGNAGLYRKMMFKLLELLKQFLPDRDFGDGSNQEVAERIHMIKGAAGNLAVQPLYEAYAGALELLRGGEADAAKEVLLAIQPVQEKLMACIEKYN